jgi:lysine biosynthesis protein LysW
MTNLTAKCPDCRNVIVFPAMPRLNQTVVCDNCEVTLAVVNLKPIELDWAYDEDEYEDFDDFDFDEVYDEDEDAADDDYDDFDDDDDDD